LATIGGHGFGAKVATATAINHLNRFTGVVCLEGGPLDHRHYESYQELASYIEAVRDLKIESLSA
jgi:pimeloyl-ACP methyl ester carboxylesterase